MDRSSLSLGEPPASRKNIMTRYFGTPGKLSRVFVKTPLRKRSHSPFPSISPKSSQTCISPINTPTSPRKAPKKSSPAVVDSIADDLNAHLGKGLEGSIPPGRGVSSQSRTSLSNSVVMSISECSHHADDVRSIRSRQTLRGPRPESRSRSSIVGSSHQQTQPLTIMVSTETSSSSSNQRKKSPAVRVFGRGGTGSQPRRVLPANLPTLQIETRKQLLHRPAGRGGAGSRPRPLSKSVSMQGPLYQRNQAEHVRTGAWAGKQKVFEEDLAYEHSFSTDWYCDSRNWSSSTVSSIYFAPVSEVGDPSPQSNNPTTRASSAVSSWFDSSSPSHTDVELEEDSDSPPADHRNRSLNKRARTLGGLHPSATQAKSTREAQTQTDPEGIPQRSLEKLSRTLGDLPPVYEALLREPPFASANVPKYITDDVKSTLSCSSSSSSFQRPSLSMGSVFHRMVGRRRDSDISDRTVSTPTSSVSHLYDVHADISGSWGEMDTISVRSTPQSSFISTSPSPPASPTTASIAQVIPHFGLEETLLEEDQDQVAFTRPASALSSTNSDWHTPPTTPTSPFAPLPADTRVVAMGNAAPEPALDQGSRLPVHRLPQSRSYSHPGYPRRSARFSAHTHSRSASTPLTLDAVTEVSSLATPEWLIPPSPLERDEMTFSVTRPEPDHENLRVWTGEWNRNDMQDVIHGLRTLR